MSQEAALRCKSIFALRVWASVSMALCIDKALETLVNLGIQTTKKSPLFRDGDFVKCFCLLTVPVCVATGLVASLGTAF